MLKYFVLLAASIFANSSDWVPKPAQKKAPAKPEPSNYFESRIPFEIDVSLPFDDFRSLPEGSWQDNWGALASLNFKIPFPMGFSAQMGGSFGLYDWMGRSSSTTTNPDEFQQQGFVSAALARESLGKSGINAGVAYDWMFNTNFGVFVENPYISQIRGQLGYLFLEKHEFGVWATYGINTSHKESMSLPLQFRGISQLNFFYSHYFKTHGYAMIWGGFPYRRGLMYSSGGPGNWILGFQFSAPVADSWSFDGHAAYMGPRGTNGIVPAKNYASDICVGLTYSFGKRRLQKSPYMSLPNNSNFMVDTNQNF